VKPFDLRELEARIQSVYKRAKNIHGDNFAYEDVQINLKKRVFTKK
jgi:DNA-binding response OmpR family regulator